MEKYWEEGQTEALPLEETWDIDWKQIRNNVTIDDTDILYDVYVCLYHGIVEAGKETTYAMAKAYLDTKVDYAYDSENKVGYYTYDGEPIMQLTEDGEAGYFDMINDIKIVIQAFGIQEAGIADVYEAYKLFQEQFAE